MAGEERSFRFILHYDGSGFFGWQIQREERTVQGELQAALERLTGAPRNVTAAGRTDRGVHATGQVASVTLTDRWTAGSLRKALNAVLPSDLWVADAALAPPEFHPRYDAIARVYSYRLGVDERADSPFRRAWCWPLVRQLNTDLLNASAAVLPGDHSFKAFAKAGQEERGDRCTIAGARWTQWELGSELTITANRFLHHMVRYLVGTMVDIARGRRPLDDMERLLDPGDSELETSPPAPPRGLFLRHVEYAEAAIAIPETDSEGSTTS